MKKMFSLSLSLPQLGKHHRFGGAATTPPPKAPREGSVVEATIGGGGLVVTILLRPQIRCKGGEDFDMCELQRRAMARFLEDLGFASFEEREAIHDTVLGDSCCSELDK
ncbi:hypothetical protein JHK86_035280 [Glycine max]|nr:hypothetical protein JHK86_035280 [Glycine max]